MQSNVGQRRQDLDYLVECRACGRWMTVRRPGSPVGAHYNRHGRPGEPPPLCIGTGQPGIFLFSEMRPPGTKSHAQRLRDRWK
jgi:hypothetical protein